MKIGVLPLAMSCLWGAVGYSWGLPFWLVLLLSIPIAALTYVVLPDSWKKNSGGSE